MGLMLPAGFATFNEYFVKKRVLMMSITQSIVGVVMMIYPIMVQYLMNTYGFRGALAVIAAINGHAILGMLVMHPVKWHYRIIQVPDEESQPCKIKLYSDHTNSISKFNYNHFIPVVNNEMKMEAKQTVSSTEEINLNDKKASSDVKTNNPLKIINEVTDEDRNDVDSRSISSKHNVSLQDLDSTQNAASIDFIMRNIICDDVQATKHSKWYWDPVKLRHEILLNILLILGRKWSISWT